MRCLIALGFLLLAGTAEAVPRYVWHDQFSSTEARMLRDWVAQADRGISALLSPIPPPFVVHLHRRGWSGEPVPWANTMKRDSRAVHFHVDPRYSSADFIADWTAPHELVHLLFPYLGEQARWFAEGVASYFQYPVMVAAGSMDWAQATERLSERLRRARNLHRSDGRSIIDLNQYPSGRHANVRLYWGGAAYFLIADYRLQQQTGRRLNQLIGDYVDCCAALWGRGAEAIIRRLDRLSGTTVFSGTYDDTVSQRGFPDFHEALQWFAEQPMPQRAAPPARVQTTASAAP